MLHHPVKRVHFAWPELIVVPQQPVAALAGPGLCSGRLAGHGRYVLHRRQIESSLLTSLMFASQLPHQGATGPEYPPGRPRLKV